MDIHEWTKQKKLPPCQRLKGIWEFRNKAVKHFNIQKGEIIHHLRETEEQRQFNDQHYERWGFDFDGEMKYCIKMTAQEHRLYHGQSKETRKKKSIHNARLSGKDHPFFGKHHTEEAKKTMSEKRKGMLFFNNGVINKRALECPSGFVKGKLISEIERASIQRNAARQKGITHSQYGKKKSIETRRKISESKKGCKWYNNGIQNKMAFECPPGYILGRLWSA
jgi:hypothetical protein